LVYGASFGGSIGPYFDVHTDAAGRFQGKLPNGTYSVRAEKAGFHAFDGSIRLFSDATLDVTLIRGISIYGHVFEFGVGPLSNATVEVTSGPNRGLKTQTRSEDGLYYLDYILPGDLTLRAGKAGYDSVDQALHVADANVNNVDFTLKWSYGTCLRSVAPLLFDHYTARGGTEIVGVVANGGHHWEMTADSPWIEVVSPYRQTGPAQMTFRIQPYPSGATLPRSGALQIRCSPSEGQNVWINQQPDCAVQLRSAADSPSEFSAAGGRGHLLMQVGVASCAWHFRSLTDWIATVGVSQGDGNFSGDLYFIVQPNMTGAERTGRLVISETEWVVRQIP